VRLTTSELATACGGIVRGPDVVVDGASFDSRSTRTGELFVPVVAERDGHRYIGTAIDAGATAYLTSEGAIDGRATALEVDDTAAALMDLARLARHRLGDRVVGVTGSVGKTTVKDLTAAVLRTTLRATANHKSFNNELGLPATMLGAPDGTEAIVLEMGMRGLGEIARLCDVAQPTVGVITVIGEAHTGRVGGLEGVARAKGELLESLPPTGTAVLNADQEICWAIRSRTRARVLGFGIERGDVRATAVELDDAARARFTLESEWGRVAVRLPWPGRHNVLNAAAAAAVGLLLGVPLDAIAAGLASATVSPWRMEVRRTAHGALVINDAYNANPTSMRAALEALSALSGDGQRIAVLGPMAELDEGGPAAHRSIAALAAELGVRLVPVGAADYGVQPVVSIGPGGGASEVLAAVGPLVDGDAVLVKGSRVAALERVADALAPGPPGP
jgi:UDP-N-acetylmuramoyl-tripeptide--D-alanyl-D-alanine ligase